MLDVHPAHHAATTWRDFLIHIATIVLGLLIAIGLEQTVEAVHHRNQRAELREALQTETEKIVKDTTDTEDRKLTHVAWLDRRTAQVRAALGQGQPLLPPDQLKYPPYIFADDPIWRSAKTSGLVSLLPPEEINAYSEVELGVNGVGITHAEEEIARGKLRSFEASLPVGPDGSADWAHLTPADLRTYLGLLNDDREAVWRFRNWSMRTLATEDCIRRRDWPLQDIVANQTKFLAAAHL